LPNIDGGSRGTGQAGAHLPFGASWPIEAADPFRAARARCRMGQRPAHIVPPAYLSRSPPVPAPGPAKDSGAGARPTGEAAGRPEPTRYGDWESKGIAIDF
jgi:hypothetical protein